jgi:hypothetical protein
MGRIIAILLGIYIFSCSGEHATEGGSAESDSSAVVTDTIKYDTTFIEVDVQSPTN